MTGFRKLRALLFVILLCAPAEAKTAFQLSSSAFDGGEIIPRQYTCDGADISPPLAWSGAPEGVKSFVLLVDDPDAPGGTWHHWAVYNIPSIASHLDETAAGLRQAVNDFGKPGYGGPCPPPGHGKHHYHFRLMALDTAALDLPGQATGTAVAQAAQSHVIDMAEVTGLYGR